MKEYRYILSRLIKVECGRRFYIGVALAALSVISCYLFATIIIGLMLAAAFVISGLFTLSDKLDKRVEACIFALFALLSLAVVSVGPNISFRFSPKAMQTNAYMNYLIVFILFVLVLFISARPRFSLILMITLLGIITTVNWFLFHFRGTDLTPTDFISIGTAIEVASEYTMRGPGPRLTYVILFEILLIFTTFAFNSIEIKPMRVRAFSAIILIASIVCLTVLSQGAFSKQWRRTGTIRIGLFYNLYLITKESFVEKPDGYSPESVAEIANRYASLDISHNASEEDYPNIIVIMNESWVDIDSMGDLHADIDELTPFIHSLRENTIKGTAISSTYGGGTSKSEFEFLTGHSMGFLPGSSIPYQQFINHGISTLPTYMKSIGYDVAVTHPFRRNGWRRDKVYPLIGLENSTFMEDYPEDVEHIRKYISDQAMYDYMLDEYFPSDSQSPRFLFSITMQNHGGYTYEEPDFESCVHLDKEFYGGDCPKAEQYLSLLTYTDEAFKDLISKVSAFDDKTVILMFGDHHVNLDEQFYDRLTDNIYSTNEDEIGYRVPFIIWANYDIEEYDVDVTSLNYLPLYLMKACGIELSPYYQWLSDINKEIPAINKTAFYSNALGGFVNIEDANEHEAKILNEYAQVQYNNIFDHKHRNSIFFK